MSGGTTNTEAHLIFEKLISFSPDLVIAYDGWNDLKADYPVENTVFYWQETCEIGRENNFDVIISLQPLVGFGDKKLTQQEAVNSFTGEDNYGYQLISAKSTYDYIGRELLSLPDDCNVVDLRGTFDDVSGPIYWDQGHVSDTANLILAEKFHEIVNEIIFNKKSNEGKFHSVISKYNSPIITSYLLSKIGIDVDYTQIKKQNLDAKDKRDGNYFYLKNQLGGSENILVGKDLSKTDLSKINLAGQDLSGANLSGTADNLKDLREIDLTGTILRGANLSFTNLSGKDLSGMDLRGINFHNANLENADLSNITISKSIQSNIQSCASLGITNKLGAYAMGSYQLKIADEHYLRFGLSAGLLQFSINDGEVDASDLEDPLLVNKNFSSTAVDGTFGIGYVNKNLELGLGINAGHDLSLENLEYFAKHILNLDEVSIGHALISDAIYLGLENTIQMYKRLL